MATQDLKDSRGFLLGRIVTDQNGLQAIQDAKGFKKGWYDPRTNTTYRANGFRVGTGNLLATLLR